MLLKPQASKERIPNLSHTNTQYFLIHSLSLSFLVFDAHLKETRNKPWLVWLRGLNAGLRTKMSQVQFLVGVCAASRAPLLGLPWQLHLGAGGGVAAPVSLQSLMLVSE